ncbi:BlaI/MecI/CopY family transcriptional regulator [Piscirickettsia litoralis]|uniref:BlaI/MecI/CopY family transcriptional regulator n=1 Tax=Piscirickettsia litoralis TaxID=1891921 RepID=UPI001112E665|nr:BlaI/MecI/CopY family transcriptional regulator [Piscirickettsia litoralis]
MQGNNSSGPIETAVLSKYIGASYGTTKTSIARLVSKGFLERQKGKTARGGYIDLKIPEEIKEILIEQKQSMVKPY